MSKTLLKIIRADTSLKDYSGRNFITNDLSRNVKQMWLSRGIKDGGRNNGVLHNGESQDKKKRRAWDFDSPGA